VRYVLQGTAFPTHRVQATMPANMTIASNSCFRAVSRVHTIATGSLVWRYRGLYEASTSWWSPDESFRWLTGCQSTWWIALPPSVETQGVRHAMHVQGALQHARVMAERCVSFIYIPCYDRMKKEGMNPGFEVEHLVQSTPRTRGWCACAIPSTLSWWRHRNLKQTINFTDHPARELIRFLLRRLPRGIKSTMWQWSGTRLRPAHGHASMTSFLHGFPSDAILAQR
jgi:hypothetical protein